MHKVEILLGELLCLAASAGFMGNKRKGDDEI